MVYSMKDNGSFFHGGPPLEEKETLQLQEDFQVGIAPENNLLPLDYLAFLQIHDGFCKYTDTGLILSTELLESYNTLQRILLEKDPLFSEKGVEVNPRSLIPFYESFGLQAYQCFWGDWYAEQEMGNVYYSSAEQTLSKVGKKDDWVENLVFPTFLDWLAFYLEAVE
jgi:hypothetical protein